MPARLHDDGVAGMHHHVANFGGITAARIVIGLGRRIAVGALQLDFIAGQRVSPPVMPMYIKQAVRCEQFDLAGILHFAHHGRRWW